jgi:hypothetical protein
MIDANSGGYEERADVTRRKGDVKAEVHIANI